MVKSRKIQKFKSTLPSMIPAAARKCGSESRPINESTWRGFCSICKAKLKTASKKKNVLLKQNWQFHREDTHFWWVA